MPNGPYGVSALRRRTFMVGSLMRLPAGDSLLQVYYAGSFGQQGPFETGKHDPGSGVPKSNLFFLHIFFFRFK